MARAENWNNIEDTPVPDGSKPTADGRAMFIPHIEAAPGGFDVSADIYYGSKSMPTTLILQAVVNDGTGKVKTIDLKVLSDALVDNPDGYHSFRKFHVDFNELNQIFKQHAPNSPQLTIGPGTPLFLKGHFILSSPSSYHQWGGTFRNGSIYVPGDGVTPAAPQPAATTRPVVLDISVPIRQALANQFNSGAKMEKGLKKGGQVRSRVEGEGKFQIAPDEFKKVRDQLLQMAKDPNLAKQVIGDEWTLSLQDRYMLKDSHGNLVLDQDGAPKPDPMEDTYYDDPNHLAAKNDMAIRYRWTGGNNTGAWNFKPGMGKVTPDGLVYRTEFGLDTTDDKPDSIQRLADSDHPLNIFRGITRVVKGAKPSSFLQPAIKLTDYRYKFELKHKNGLSIELSLDDVHAKSLRPCKPKT